MFKYHNESWLNGLATYYALEIDPHSSFLGQQLRRLPSWIFKFATYTTLFIETFIPFLLLLGSKNQKARLVALLIFTALVLGFLLFLEIGTFPIVFLAGLVAAYPSCFWNSFKIKTFKIDLAPIRIVSTRPNSIMVFILGSLLLLSHFNSISSNTIKIPEFLNTNFYQPLGLKQNWGVFCQDTWKSYSIVLEAKTKEGYPSDLWKWWSDGNEGDPSWIFPPSPYYVRNNFRSSLWRDLLFYVAPINDNQEIPNLTKALCNKYNSEMSEKIVSVKALRAQREVIGYHKYWFSPGEKIFEIRCGTDPR